MKNLPILLTAPVSCAGCGACCIGFKVPVFPSDDQVPAKLVHRKANGFGHMKRRKDQSCVAFDRKTKRCTIYENRPEICVEYARGGSSCLQKSAELELPRITRQAQQRITRQNRKDNPRLRDLDHAFTAGYNAAGNIEAALDEAGFPKDEPEITPAMMRKLPKKAKIPIPEKPHGKEKAATVKLRRSRRGAGSADSTL